jgi:tRNA threonylcarbamoyl adenosine modification protein (Sua5/YciO/YrdC/YwlC family)
MATRIKLHPVTPQQKRVFEIVDRLRSGEIMVLPTDSQYALACSFTNKRGVERIRAIRNLRKDHLFTLILDSLNAVSRFAHLGDTNFKLIRRLIPGPFTFVLPATKEVPRLLMHPSRKTIGIRVPENTICQKIIEELGEPLMATTATLPEQSNTVWLDTTDIYEAFQPHIDMFIDDEMAPNIPVTSILDLTRDTPVVMRAANGMDKIRHALDYSGIPFEEPHIDL